LIKNGLIKELQLNKQMKPYQYLLHSTQESNGQNVPPSDMLEINLTVDHVGHTELPKHIMIDYVLKLTEHSTLCYQQQIPPHVVDSSVVSLKDVTEDKSEPHGLGSKITELSPEEILQILKLVILILCNNVLTTLILLNIQIVQLLKKTTQLVTQNVQETMQLILQINIKLPHLIH